MRKTRAQLEADCRKIAAELGHEIENFTRDDRGRLGFFYQPTPVSFLQVECGQDVVTYVFNPDISNTSPSLSEVRQGFGGVDDVVDDIREAIAA